MRELGRGRHRCRCRVGRGGRCRRMGRERTPLSSPASQRKQGRWKLAAGT